MFLHFRLETLIGPETFETSFDDLAFDKLALISLRGLVNVSSQIKATFSPDGRYVISGSENAFTYIWKTYHEYSTFSSARRDRNAFWENIKGIVFLRPGLFLYFLRGMSADKYRFPGQP